MSSIFERTGPHDYERVVFCRDRITGLRAIVAIHDTTLGPALGGVRMRPYATEDEAIEDVLRLARGMTYKAAISGVRLGGGKSVVIGDPGRHKSAALLEALGRFVESLGGAYIAGQDIGTDAHDMAVMRGVTEHVSCVHESAGGAGDPSHATAYGVTCAIRAVLKEALGSDELEGRHVAIQGLGNVGFNVARYCSGAGARVTVTDIVDGPVRRATDQLGATSVSPDAIYDVACDVFSPCSIGAILDGATIPRLRCVGVAGGANNVLAEARHAGVLAERGILYAPDYLANSGGLIRCQEEVLGAPTDDANIFPKIRQIYDQTLDVLSRSARQGITSVEAANRMAEERITAQRRSGRAWNPLRNEPRVRATKARNESETGSASV